MTDKIIQSLRFVAAAHSNLIGDSRFYFQLALVILLVFQFVLTVRVAIARQVSQQDRSQETYRQQQRPPEDPALIARGQGLYGIHCRGCHGVDLRGGDLGGPNLLRSQLVLRDEQGESIWPVIRDGQTTAGVSSMPAQSLAQDDAEAVAAFIRSVLAKAERQGAPPSADRTIELDILIGDPGAGKVYFLDNCSSCHSATGDLAGIATEISDAKTLQNTWVRGRRRGTLRPSVTVSVTQPSGVRVGGQLERLDDFFVLLSDSNGRLRSFRRDGDVPTVEISDPLGRHTELLSIYTDKNIHDVTAYLVTLK